MGRMGITDYINMTKTIYTKLQDEKSKEIFKNRLLYSITNESRYIKNIVSMNEYGKEFLKIIHKNKIYLFGGGIWGSEITKVYGDYINGVFDNNPTKVGKILNGFVIQKPEKIINKEFDGTILITIKNGCDEIRKQLLKMGISNENIYDIEAMIKMAEKDMYFSLDKLPHDENETFIDVGCLDATTAINFAKWSKKYKKICCLEPDEKNFNKCMDNIHKHLKTDKVALYKCGAWSYNGILYMDSKGNAMSHICEGKNHGENCVSVEKLDDILKDEIPTFIKMDIEGAEMEALKGAINSIKKYKPKLAISIYHRPEDIIKLLWLINEYRDDYKFYLRHYSIASFDTVLYAV